jgi:hypothetical protein
VRALDTQVGELRRRAVARSAGVVGGGDAAVVGTRREIDVVGVDEDLDLAGDPELLATDLQLVGVEPDPAKGADPFVRRRRCG